MALLPAAALPAALGAQLRARAIGSDAAWATWWHPAANATAWRAPSPVLQRAVRWTPVAAGIDHAELALSGRGEAWRLRVQLVRVDPALVRLRLDADVAADGALQPWTINATEAARRALVAVNAGQFTDRGPWGWIVHEGREVQAPGRGALAGAIVVHDDGRVRIEPPARIDALRGSGAAGITEAVQSYPMLLEGDGDLPALLRSGIGIDLAHRDARLAIGTLRDGRVLLALTRFDAAGVLLARVPFGLTVPEMAALMGALGCQRALLLDGGISAQLAVASPSRARRAAWPGLRQVPLGLIVVPR